MERNVENTMVNASMNHVEGLKIKAFSFLLLAFCFCCSSSSKEEALQNGWTIVIKGKVGFPQKGEISIQELKNDPEYRRAWKDKDR